jgi:FKBP-type peptidyl-prolyl cis-trans isomerase
MTRKRDRIFAGFGAALFLGTASALTIAVIASGVSNHRQTEAAAAAAKTTTPTTAAKSTSSTTSNSTASTTKLEGTKMENFTPTTDVPKLEIQDLTVGTGAEVKAGDTVTVDYTGAVAATGVIFQSSLDSGQPVTFGLSQVIQGWTNGVPGMKVGGTRRLTIPAAQAYGANPPSGSGIPANANLVFDITLHKIGG